MFCAIPLLLYIILTLYKSGYAQITYNPERDTLSCSKPGGHYCWTLSLEGPLIVTSITGSSAEVISCNKMLGTIIPQSYRGNAVCYESSENAGDAVCAFNGTGYSLTEDYTVDVPETIICDSLIPPQDDPQDLSADPISGYDDHGDDDGYDDNDNGGRICSVPSHFPSGDPPTPQTTVDISSFETTLSAPTLTNNQETSSTHDKVESVLSASTTDPSRPSTVSAVPTSHTDNEKLPTSTGNSIAPANATTAANGTGDSMKSDHFCLVINRLITVFCLRWLAPRVGLMMR